MPAPARVTLMSHCISAPWRALGQRHRRRRLDSRSVWVEGTLTELQNGGLTFSPPKTEARSGQGPMFTHSQRWA